MPERWRGTGPRPTVRVAFFSCASSVVCDRLITNGSGAGAPDLQSGSASSIARRPVPATLGDLGNTLALLCTQYIRCHVLCQTLHKNFKISDFFEFRGENSEHFSMKKKNFPRCNQSIPRRFSCPISVVCERSQMGQDCMAVVCDRLITNGSGSGDPDLQFGERTLVL